jgi:hypothetical protein
VVRPRLSLPSLVVAGATALALYSAWHSGGHVLRRAADDHRTYAGYTALQRQHAAIDAIPLPSDIFDFYAAYVERGDRIYFQVLESGFGSWADLPTAVSAAGRYYLLPAVAVGDLADATVVVSYEADPNTLGVHYITQVRAGLQPIFVSRIRPPTP